MIQSSTQDAGFLLQCYLLYFRANQAQFLYNTENL